MRLKRRKRIVKEMKRKVLQWDNCHQFDMGCSYLKYQIVLMKLPGHIIEEHVRWEKDATKCRNAFKLSICDVNRLDWRLFKMYSRWIKIDWTWNNVQLKHRTIQFHSCLSKLLVRKSVLLSQHSMPWLLFQALSVWVSKILAIIHYVLSF